jgi:hypothetical protein
MFAGTIRAAAGVVLPLMMSCAGSKGTTEAPAAATGAPDAGVPATTRPVEGRTAAADAGTSAEAAAPAGRAFAHTPLEAQSLIQEQIEARTNELWKCVTAYRQRKGDPHKAVVVDIGIDQEGTLLGVVAPSAAKQGSLEPALRDCLMASLQGLPFPRSHSGVITVRQNFSDAAISR